MNIESILKKVGYRPFRAAELARAVDMPSYLGRVWNKLPVDYQEFLLSHPSTGGFDEEVVFKGVQQSPWAEGGREILDVLYGQCSEPRNDLLLIQAQYSGQISPDFFIIGEVVGSNLICIDLRLDSRGDVYLWDREGEGGVDLYFINHGFNFFLESLAVASQNEKSEAGKRVSVEMSDEFKARIAEFLKKK